MSEGARHELAATIHDEAQRMSVLVSNLLDMARLESGNAQIKRQWSSLEELIGSVLTRLGDPLSGHPVNVALPDDLPLINVDPVLIEQVLANLLENAAKYTPAGTSIDVSADATDNRVAVEIADRGPGIPAGEEARLFDKFYRLKSESAQSGVGLGLAICKAIIVAHGGTIIAMNRPGGGALFRFELPAAEPPTVESETESESSARTAP